MNLKTLAVIASLSLPSISGAATLAFDYSNLADSSGTLLTSGIIRFGVFQTNDFTQSISDLADDFIQIGSYNITGNNAFTSLTYANTANNTDPLNLVAGTTYTSGDTLTTLFYDLTPVDNSVDPAAIAGRQIYAWVLDNAAFGSVLEHGIFSNAGYLWIDDQQIPADFSTFSFDVSSLDGMVAHVGTASDDIFNPASPHRLAAIPEPSRAVLGLIGLTGVMFRRRRAVKA
jgi:hypothetical protein